MIRLPVHVSELKKEIRQLSYLLGVQKRQQESAENEESKEDSTEGMCPVCRDVQDVMFVYPCAHMTCVTCTKKLISGSSVTCCVCRQKCRKSDLIRARRKSATTTTTTTTSTSSKKNEEEEKEQAIPEFKSLSSSVIQYGTKIAGIVREMSLLCWKEPDVKVRGVRARYLPHS